MTVDAFGLGTSEYRSNDVRDLVESLLQRTMQRNFGKYKRQIRLVECAGALGCLDWVPVLIGEW